MSDDDGTPGGAEGAVPEAGKGWSEQDRWVLIITFAGALAANVGTVILVGGAIAFAHLSRHAPAWSGLVTALVASVGGVCMFALGSAIRRRRVLSPPPWDPRTRFNGWLLVVFGSLLVLEAALIVVGLAAGVK